MTISIDKIEIFPDPHTESVLLPTWLQENSNSDRLRHMKIALSMVMRTRLTPEQRNILFWHYQQRKTKTEISRILGIGDSAVCKKIKSAQTIIKDYVGLYMSIYGIITKEQTP